MASLIADVYPELFHYTGIIGLEGILKSQTLRATHAAFLNDATEIRSFQERLPGILRPAVERGVAELARQVPQNQAIIDQIEGNAKAIDEIAAGIATGMYNALLGTQDTHAFAEPYVTSFCTAATQQIAQHGLLSQWRGYGHEGGYALVFDTSRLDSLLKEEREKWQYDLFGGDVIYSSDEDERIRNELGHDMDVISTSIAEWLRTAGKSLEFLEPIYYALIRCACRYKHWGFHEEKEVRIIASPPNKELFEAQKAHIQQTHGVMLAEKPRRYFVRAGTPVPCIHLFEGITQLPGKSLPITRVIVGPYRDKEKRRRALESLLAQYSLDIPVSVSDIPYVGNF